MRTVESSSHCRGRSTCWTRGALWAAVLLAGLGQAGCKNSLVMFSKILLGDPMQLSAFEQATGVNLKKDQKSLVLHTTAPSFLAEEHGTLTADIQEELIHRMRRRSLVVAHTDAASKVLDRFGGQFDPQVLVRELKDADYIAHIQIDRFSHREESSPNLYRGKCSGRVTAYQARGEGDTRHAVMVFDQQFQTQYPTNYPVPMDQTPKNVFIRRFINHIADCLGASFYNVHTNDLFEH